MMGIPLLTKLVEVDLSGNPLKLQRAENRNTILPVFNALPALASLLLVESSADRIR
jgi:hypothetical protein